MHNHTQHERIDKPLDFRQVGEFYRSLTPADRDALIGDFAADLGHVRDDDVRTAIVSFSLRADEEYGRRLADTVFVDLDQA